MSEYDERERDRESDIWEHLIFLVCRSNVLKVQFWAKIYSSIYSCSWWLIILYKLLPHEDMRCRNWTTIWLSIWKLRNCMIKIIEMWSICITDATTQQELWASCMTLSLRFLFFRDDFKLPQFLKQHPNTILLFKIARN